MIKINKERKKLTIPNRDVFDQMNEYLSGKNLNDLVKKDILLDILGMFQEGQKRNVDTKEIFGDYESFCDEVAKNGIQKTKLEHILASLMNLCLIIVCIIVFAFIHSLISNYSILDNMSIIISNEMLVYLLGAFIACIHATNLRAKVTYRYPFGKGYIYFVAAMILYIAVSLFIRNVFAETISISIYTAVSMLIIAISIIYGYIKIRNLNYKKYKN